MTDETCSRLTTVGLRCDMPATHIVTLMGKDLYRCAIHADKRHYQVLPTGMADPKDTFKVRPILKAVP